MPYRLAMFLPDSYTSCSGWSILPLLSRTWGWSVHSRVYVAMALIVCIPMLLIWFNSPHNITEFTPAVIYFSLIHIHSYWTLFPDSTPFLCFRWWYYLSLSVRLLDHVLNAIRIIQLVGIVALNVLRVLEPTDPRAVGVLLVGYFFQGIGFFMT